MTTPATLKLHTHDTEPAQLVQHALAMRAQTHDLFMVMTREQAQRLRRRVYHYLDALKASGHEDNIDAQALFRAMYTMRIVRSDAAPGMFTIRFKVDSSWHNGQIIADIILKRKKHNASLT